MDYILLVPKIYENPDFNPACFNFSEEEAREKKLWRDSRPMPTSEQMQTEWDKIKIEIEKNKYKEERREKYQEQGLFFDKFVEMLIENDTAGIEDFRAKRSVIKLEIPK